MKITLGDDKLQEERAKYDAEREAIKKTFKGKKRSFPKCDFPKSLNIYGAITMSP